MIRPFRSEIERYGEYSKAGEFVYDHPFQWGSKRTGPDLAREGLKYDHAWHFNHMARPQDMEEKSIMPAYPWLLTEPINMEYIPSKISAQRTIGVPYAEGYENLASVDLEKQAREIYDKLLVLDEEGKLYRSDDGESMLNENSEILALIAYLQRLGTDIKVKEPITAK